MDPIGEGEQEVCLAGLLVYPLLVFIFRYSTHIGT